MMSISTTPMSGCWRISSIAWRPFVALTTSISWFSSSVVSAKMLRASSSTTSTLRPRSTSLEAWRRLEHLLLGLGQVGDHAVQEERRLVEEPFRRLHVLEQDALRQPAQPLLLLAGQVLAGEDDDRDLAQARLRLQLLQQLEAAHVGQAQVEDAAVEGPVEELLDRLGARSPTWRSRCRRGCSSSTMLCRSIVVVLDDQQPLDVRLDEFLDPVEALVEALGRGRLYRRRRTPRAPAHGSAPPPRR